ncbi:fungal-specific transcription factor domain-containing protein [Crepidotus variabilis]|uniref:Fungal-specific transcription factor domain-containing protein n=1 Tax=Crepidotus variabilis TaxID=179855 RepID=A0A9P6EN54_9AGAR|nr:fungal-specific transcription factor domain-containing protein [Crepidotus variabilis]
MTTPPAESSPSANTSQPSVPPQPLPPTPTQPPAKPTQSTTRKPRQRKRADQQDKPQSQPAQQPAAQPVAPVVQSQPPPPSYHTPRGPVFQPYPGPPYHMMNPSYPMNGSPYGQHPQHPPHGQPMNPQGHPPPPPQYGYPMHPGYGHPYPPYAQYPQPMMMYPPPRHDGQPDAPHPEPQESVSTTGTKRKRKSLSQGGRQVTERGSDDDTVASGNEVQRPPTAQAQHSQSTSAADLKKRTKTQRACDSCRSRKIRCDVLTDADPPVCQHCKQYGFECTFFLPITETRFKKKKLEEEAEKEKVAAAAAESAKIIPREAKRDIGVFGPTSTIHLLHSQATINPRVYEGYDLRYHHLFEVSKSGDGLIQVQKPAQEDQEFTHPKPADLNIERDVVEQLVNVYFAEIAPLLPIVTEAEFLAATNPPPVLIYSMCLIAACRRQVSPKVFDSIRYTVNSILKAEDVLSTPSIVNIQALLILCMSADCHSQFVPSAVSALWIRLGTAIRMAQDLGLHRAEAVKQDIEVRRRLWAACLISDRWAAIAYGFPFMIDIQDCDARLPSSGDSTDLYMDELVRLSILLGRVQKTIYSPSGLTFTTDEILYDLLADLQRWIDGLPEHLKFKGPNASQTAGLLHLLYSCVCMMFWRVFMRISYSCPAHLKFAMTVEQWSGLVEMTADCIDWLDSHDSLYDIWFLITYAATSCALVQYHTYVRRKDQQAAGKLLKLRDCVRRWEAGVSPEHMSAKRKSSEIISLLYEATQGPQLPLQAPMLNPTGGVKPKEPVVLEYKKDPSRPGSGVFIANSKRPDMQELEGVVISKSDDEDGESEGEEASPAAQATVVASSPSLSANNHNDKARPDLPSARTPSSSSVPKFARKRTLPPDAFEQSMFTAPAPTAMQLLGTIPYSADIKSQEAQLAAATGPNAAPLVKLTPLTAGAKGGHYMNVNPAMNLQAQAGAGNVQVMNVLDSSVPSGNNLADFQMADNGFLEGLPGGMFDWGQWDNFFSRFGHHPHAHGNPGSSVQAPQKG